MPWSSLSTKLTRSTRTSEMNTSLLYVSVLQEPLHRAIEDEADPIRLNMWTKLITNQGASINNHWLMSVSWHTLWNNDWSNFRHTRVWTCNHLSTRGKSSGVSILTCTIKTGIHHITMADTDDSILFGINSFNFKQLFSSLYTCKWD